MRSILFLVGLCLAATGQQSFADDDVGFDPVYRNCFSRKDWNRASVSFKAAKKYRTQWYDAPVRTLVGGLTSVTTSVDRGIDWADSVFTANPRHLNAQGQFEILTNYIKHRAKDLPNDQWTDFRKGCMVLCVSANYLKYEERMSTKMGHIDRLAEEKHGVCTEFAAFADKLAGRVGIASHRVTNLAMGHAYVKFYMPAHKKWYYAEPQNPACEYLDPAH
jgi:hypothetical protein